MIDTLRANFAAEHRRPPTPAEAIALTEQARAEARDAERARHERELRRAYLDTPGATEDDWAKQRDEILATDRAAQAVKNKDAARRAQGRLYRSF